MCQLIAVLQDVERPQNMLELCILAGLTPVLQDQSVRRRNAVRESLCTNLPVSEEEFCPQSQTSRARLYIIPRLLTSNIMLLLLSQSTLVNGYQMLSTVVSALHVIYTSSNSMYMHVNACAVALGVPWVPILVWYVHTLYVDTIVATLCIIVFVWLSCCRQHAMCN